MKKYFLSILFFACNFLLFSQNHVNIQLETIEQNNQKKVCYNIQLAAADGIDLNLAGQNYRLFFDASELSFTSSVSLLPEGIYDNFIIRKKVSQVSAEGLGSLPFNQHLGFLNISIDLKEIEQGGRVLSRSGDWVSTCQICFDKLGSITSSKEETIIWAREELTNKYASAYVEVAEWLEKNVTVPAKVAIYNDKAFQVTAISTEQWEDKVRIYPNPVKNVLSIDQSATKNTTLEILSINGKKSYQTTIPQGENHFQFNTSNLTAGTYQIRLIKDNQQHIQFFEKL